MEFDLFETQPLRTTSCDSEHLLRNVDSHDGYTAWLERQKQSRSHADLEDSLARQCAKRAPKLAPPMLQQGPEDDVVKWSVPPVYALNRLLIHFDSLFLDPERW